MNFGIVKLCRFGDQMVLNIRDFFVIWRKMFEMYRSMNLVLERITIIPYMVIVV
ncbi:hypothetical protein Hanom_Chr10g00897051 [Helianthus anomalus]